MPYELFLALRYLRVRRGRRVARWTALAAVVGIACGVAALIVALALANGFRDELRDKILRGTAHVTLSREGEGGEGPRATAERVRKVEGVSDASPTAYEGALLSGPAGATYTVLRGVDERSTRARSQVQSTVTKGSLDSMFAASGVGANAVDRNAVGDEAPVPVVLGEELAERTGLTRVGDEGWVLTGDASPETGTYVPRARRVRVAGLFRSGLYEYDSTWTYLALDAVGRVAGSRPGSTVISVEARDVYESGALARRLRAELGEGWAAADWGETNRALFDALALERRTVALIIMLITIVAALNITTTLALVVVERRADIAVLVALGARARSVTLVFMLEGAIVGAVGALAGVVFGLAACFAADRFNLVRLPTDVYSLSSVPLHPHAADVLIPALAAFAVSLIATLYPARQAARVRPAEVLRYE
ncbi:MAG TPA: ABC transporter permease [Pyrinomonadaceae bacterium]|jgi:lipoprotein-releasing system permease protein|nr:ABC transporter permease [Pyrinomonadaceae bacterium]